MKRDNEYKNKFVLILRAIAGEYGLRLEEEVKFAEDRKFRFDFAFRELKIAFEYEGIFSQGGVIKTKSGKVIRINKKSRHLTVGGYSRDVEKYNLAQAQGWIVIRATPITLSKKKITQLYDLIKKIVEERKKIT